MVWAIDHIDSFHERQPLHRSKSRRPGSFSSASTVSHNRSSSSYSVTVCWWRPIGTGSNNLGRNDLHPGERTYISGRTWNASPCEIQYTNQQIEVAMKEISFKDDVSPAEKYIIEKWQNGDENPGLLAASAEKPAA